MKNWKKIAVLLLILVVFVTAFIFINNNQKNVGDANTASPTPNPADSLKLVDIERAKIAKIILKREENIVLTLEEKEIEKLNQTQDGKTQKVKEKAKVWVTPGFDVDTDIVEDIALAADTATTSRLIEESPKDLTIYGLDKPLVSSFVSDDGKENSIEIGDKTPTGDSYYVRKTGNANVYTLDSYKGDTLVYGKYDIMNKNLYGTGALVFDDVSALTFTKAGQKVFDSNLNASTKLWEISYPLARKADMQELSKFAQWTVDFRASEFIEENPADLKAYGLDNPKYVFDYTIGGKAYNLKVGAQKDSKYYGQMAGNPAVFTIDASTLSFVDIPLIDLIDTFVYIPAIYDVDKLVIEMDGRTDELVLDASQETDYEEKFYLNGKKIEGEDNITMFKRYYQGAIGIAGDKIDLNAVPSGKAFATLTYTMKKASPDKVVKVELIPTDDNYGYYLVKNGQYSGLVMGSRQLDDPSFGIRTHYKNMLDEFAKSK